MRYKWLNKKNNNKLIIFFNGWGMSETPVKRINPEDYDVLMFYDYNTLDFDLKFDKIYGQIGLVAWSMGVMAASICLNVKEYNSNTNPLCSLLSSCKEFKSTAINGTLMPISFEYGIPPRIYDLTIKGFDENGRDKFVKNMFDSSNADTYLSSTEKLHAFLRDDTVESLKSELIALKNYEGNRKFRFDKVYISKNDKIIPTKNQVKFWGVEPNLEGGHFPFFNFSKWSEIL